MAHSVQPTTPAERTTFARADGPRHLMSVIVEDYFQVGAFRKHIEPRQWDRFESRLFRNTRAALDLLARYDVRATFFVLGWNAAQWPDLVRLIVDEGHEVASGGFQHESLRELDRTSFCAQLQQAREAIESAAGQPVLGYRMAEGWLTPESLWLLDYLAEQGYAYDSSLLARGRTFRDAPWRSRPHPHESPTGRLWELPPSSLRLPLVDLPIAGGNYFRQIPHTLMKHVIARRDRVDDQPLMLYFHVWELDTEQPEVSAASRLMHVRHYRNLGKMNWVLADYLTRYRFGPVAEYLRHHDRALWDEREAARSAEILSRSAAQSEFAPPRTVAPVVQSATTEPVGLSPTAAIPVTVVVPCFNEQQTIPYLLRTLDGLRKHLSPEYRAEFVLVDDGSRDATWELLQGACGAMADITLLRHETNQGVTRAIMTGLGAAETDIVCSMDCDCSYDPHKLKEMIPLLTEDVDLVTASPYHAEGSVKNVPGWRLLLSRGASSLYRLVLGQPLATYTSCFRVYRRASVAGLTIENGNFLGVAELLGKLLLQGGQVVEFPATLSVRLFGQSKMKTLRTIGGHLSLLSRLLWLRLQAQRSAAVTAGAASPDRAIPRSAPRAAPRGLPRADNSAVRTPNA